MSQAISPTTNKPYGLKRVCEAWDIARCSFYRKCFTPEKRGPKPNVEEKILLEKIQKDLQTTPFRGEGHRKVHARLKRAGTKVGRNRVLRVMKENNLLSPKSEVLIKPPNPHDGQITTFECSQRDVGIGRNKSKTVDDGFTGLDFHRSRALEYRVSWLACMQSRRPFCSSRGSW